MSSSSPTLVPFLVPPLHWSGSVDAVLLAIIFDTTSDGDIATSVSQPRTIPVDIFPVGDCFELINLMTVTEDLGPGNCWICTSCRDYPGGRWDYSTK
jgi:hypothetical protein